MELRQLHTTKSSTQTDKDSIGCCCCRNSCEVLTEGSEYKTLTNCNALLMKMTFTRRSFLRRLGVTATGTLVAGPSFAEPRKLSANEKLNIGVIGVANQGKYNLGN